MRSDKNILVAFLLNLFFGIFEFFGGMMTNSVSIMSDAIHDMGDSLSIGVSLILEKVSKRKPDNKYTYGYVRYSVMGSLITTIILLVGSIFVVVNAVDRMFNPVDINYNGMIGFTILGVTVNFMAAYFTKDGNSLNQKAVNLHMLEDVLGWVIVLIGSLVIKFTKIFWIDSILSIIISIIIVLRTISHLNEVLDLFLLKKPGDIDIEELKRHIHSIEGVNDVHHVHVWSLDGINNFATLHVVTDKNIKDKIREELEEHGINNATIEIENSNEKCHNKKCKIEETHHHHHHH